MANISSGMGLGLSRPGRKGVLEPASGDTAGKLGAIGGAAGKVAQAAKIKNIKSVKIKVKAGK